MITPSHIIYNWALGAKLKLDRTGQTGLILGGFLPDVQTYLFFFVHTFILGSAQRDMWDTLYFDSGWTPFITLSHSFLLWPFLLLIGHWLQVKLLYWVAAGSIFHVAIDFLVHNDDAYRHFWPLTDWKFMSPISYWDPAHYGTLVGAADSIIIVLLLVWLYRQVSKRMQLVVIGTIILYVLQLLASMFIF